VNLIWDDGLLSTGIIGDGEILEIWGGYDQFEEAARGKGLSWDDGLDSLGFR
jgi:hypothetical protein